MSWLKVVGLDQDDVRVLLAVLVAVVAVGLALVVLGLFAGVAVGLFRVAAGWA